jgi:hypothetical protein
VAAGSPELALRAAPVSGSSPRAGEKGEELRGGGGSSPRVQKGGMVVVGEVAGGAGVFYRAGGEGTEAVGEVVGRVLG